eukprot:5048057-Pleurochrysis_carterae.AAC.1
MQAEAECYFTKAECLSAIGVQSVGSSGTARDGAAAGVLEEMGSSGTGRVSMLVLVRVLRAVSPLVATHDTCCTSSSVHPRV